MKPGRRRQRGLALLLVMAVLAMGGTWFIVKRLNNLSANHIAVDRAYNAQVLTRAKQALIGYVVAQANKAGENNPGALPCPEAPGAFNDVLNGTDGKMNSAGCSLPAVGRYPWRTIGSEKFIDAASEPLWYVVSPGWAITGVGANTSINSNSVGQLNMDGVSYTTQAAGDTVIALIIAPGPAVSVTATTGCATWNQTRSATPDVAPDWRNYLECENATSPADTNFVTSSTNSAFNDQVLKVTVADIMPGIEAAVADRIQREIDPVLKTVYGYWSGSSSAVWGYTTLNGSITSSQTTLTVASTTGMPSGSPFPSFRLLVDTELMQVTGVSGTTLTVTRGYESTGATTHSNGATLIFGGTSAIYPYPAPFSNPSTSALGGAAGNYAGLLPLSYAETSPGSGVLCTAGASAPRCAPSFVQWDTTSITATRTSGTGSFSSNCSASTATQVSCTVTYSNSCLTGLSSLCSASASISIAVTANNLGMAMRQVYASPTSRISATDTFSSPTFQANLGETGAPAGGAHVTVTGSLPASSCTTSWIWWLGQFFCSTSKTVTVTVPITVFSDHPLTNSSDGNYGWFTRNKWHELTYYAIASGYSPAALPSQPACITGSNCVTVANVTPTGGQRAILILAGRSINGSTRPSGTLSDYLEFGNATGSYERQTVSRANAPSLKKPFNDRIVAVDSN